MAQRLQPWRSGRDERQWLSMLIDTMEKIARPEVRALPTDQFLVAAVRAQLARPVALSLRCVRVQPSQSIPASQLNPIRRRF
jgi:hypothetical protein